MQTEIDQGVPMTATRFSKLAVVFGAAGVLAATLATAMTPALGAARGADHPAAGGVTLRYIDGTDVTVGPNAVGENATKCPRGMYPIGGGPSSPSALWTMHWSDPDRSAPS